jgi:hypothetical protein
MYASKGKKNTLYWCRNMKGRDLDVGNRIILKRILKKRDVRAWTGVKTELNNYTLIGIALQPLFNH